MSLFFIILYADNYLTALVVSTAVESQQVLSTAVVSTAVESTVVGVSTVSVFLQDAKVIATIAIKANNTFFIVLVFYFLHDYI